MKISYKSFGCRVNQIEVESIIEKFLKNGYEISDENPDIFIINSCCVTEKTEKEVLRFIKKTIDKNPNSKIIITGCLATVSKDKIENEFKNITIYSNENKNKIVNDFLGINDDYFSVDGFRERTRAFIKVQDGCNLKCSYCIVPLARSIMISKPFENVIFEIKRLVENGYKEIVISGTRLGAYSFDNKRLKDLLKAIEKLNGNFRVRLSSLEPMEIDNELIDIIKNSDRFCSYFHIPLQSGSDDVLKAMKRPYTTKNFAQKIEMIRKKINNVGIYSDVIVGYPTETDLDFKKTINFISELKLSGLHVFTYSPRPNTYSFKFKDLNPFIKKERSSLMHKLDKKLRFDFATSMIGKSLDSLSLRKKNNYTHFLTTNFIDVITNGNTLPGERIRVIIKKVDDKDVFGEIV